jgi:hypothetical protein
MNVINQTPTERLGGLAPKEVYLGISGYNPFHVIFAPEGVSKLTKVDLIHSDIKLHVEELQCSLAAMHKAIGRTIERRRARGLKTQHASLAFKKQRVAETGLTLAQLDASPELLLPRYLPGDFILVAIPAEVIKHKLTAVWRGPYRVTRPINNFVYEVEHLLTGALTLHHVVRTRFYADSSLDLPVKLLDEIHAEAQIQNVYDIESIMDYKFEARYNSHTFLCKWFGFSVSENTWESLEVVYAATPGLLLAYLSTLSEGPCRSSLQAEINLLDSDAMLVNQRHMVDSF